jgi:hypothetical protein
VLLTGCSNQYDKHIVANICHREVITPVVEVPVSDAALVHVSEGKDYASSIKLHRSEF